MASSRFILLAALVLAGTFCWALASGRNPSDCCLKISKREIPLNVVKCYRQQDTSNGCYIGATIVTTIRNRHLCAPVDEDWVRKIKSKKKECPSMKH